MPAYFEMERDIDNVFTVMPHHNNVCAPHFHSNIEVVHVMGGELKATINGETQLLSDGWTSIAGSYDVHTYETPEYSDTRILIIPMDSVSRYNNLMQTSCFKNHFLEPGSYNEALRAAIKELEPYSGKKNCLVSVGYLYVILGILTSKLGIKPIDKDAGSASLIRHVLFYIERHYLEPLTLSDIAVKFGYNKCYMSRLFNSMLGCGFNKYINTLRVRHAAQLIRNTDSSLDDISYQSGFQSVRNLNRYFKDYYQTTPKEYRNLERAGMLSEK